MDRKVRLVDVATAFLQEHLNYESIKFSILNRYL